MPGRWESKDDMKKMQQDAIKRVQEMQSKAKEKISQTTMTVDKDSENFLDDKKSPHMEKTKFSLGNGLYSSGSFFESLSKDSERNLILMVILILMEENIDSELLLFLMYLII